MPQLTRNFYGREARRDGWPGPTQTRARRLGGASWVLRCGITLGNPAEVIDTADIGRRLGADGSPVLPGGRIEGIGNGRAVPPFVVLRVPVREIPRGRY